MANTKQISGPKKLPGLSRNRLLGRNWPPKKAAFFSQCFFVHFPQNKRSNEYINDRGVGERRKAEKATVFLSVFFPLQNKNNNKARQANFLASYF